MDTDTGEFQEKGWRIAKRRGEVLSLLQHVGRTQACAFLTWVAVVETSAFLAADLVGPNGEVIGADCAAAAAQPQRHAHRRNETFGM